MFSNFDFDVIWRSLPYLFQQGMTFTLTLTAIATVFGLILGTLVAMMRLSSNAVLSSFAASYVNLMRSLPLVLVIFLFYFLMPYIGQWIIRADSAGAGRRLYVDHRHLHAVRGGVFLGDHARRHPVDAARAGAWPAMPSASTIAR